MTARRWSIAALGAALLSFASSAHAQALPSDLTGTYEGSMNCKFNTSETGRAGSFKSATELLVRQVTVGENGTELAVVFRDGFVETQYSGRTIETGTGKGQVAFVRCGSGESAWSQHTEIWKSKFKVNFDKGTGSISGTSVYMEAFSNPILGTLTTCKGKWKRVDTAAPAAAIGCEE